MSTYFNDCSSLTGWTDQDIGSGTQFSVSGSTITSASSTPEILSLDAVDSDADRESCEILLKYKTSAWNSTHYIGIARGSDSGSATTLAGYIVALRSTAIRTYYKNSGGSITQIATATLSALSTDTYYWVRLRCNGTSIKAKVWADGGSEPGTWDCDATDTSGPGAVDGYAGIYSPNASTHTWDSFGVGTNGDTAPASAGGGATITGDSLTHGHSLSSPSLTQANVLAVQGASQAHSLGAPALTQHNVLAVNAIAQAHALGNVTLTQAHILTVQGIGQAHSLGAPSLTQHNALTPAPLTQAQTLGNITLTIAGSIAAADIAQGHSIGTPALTQHNILAVAALMQAQSLGQPALSQAGTLAVQGMTQAQVLDAVTLVQHHALAVQALLQGHALGSITLTASDALAIDGLTHAQILGSPSLTQHNVLAVQNMTHAQILQAVTLGGLVIGSLRGTLVAYSLLDGEVVCRALLSGSLETVH